MQILTDPTNYDNVVTALGNAINTDAMFSNLASLIPVIGGCLIFAFTYRLIKKVVRGAQKGKASI